MLVWYLTFFSLLQMESGCLNIMAIGKSLFVCSEENYSRISQAWVEKMNVDMKLNAMQKKKMLFQKHSYGNIN